MGNDGGSIPTRRELVKEAARQLNTTEVKEKQKEALAHRWKECPLSHKPLLRPVVSDCAGNLYNKDAILQYLLPTEASSLDKNECDKFVQGRVKGLKDVVELQFQVEPEQQAGTERWICPITNKVLGPSVKAVYIVPCGHVFSQEAVREMKTDKCLQCDEAYESRDMVPILPMIETEQTALKLRLEALTALGLTHSLKRASGSSKKRKANGIAKADPTSKNDTSIEALPFPQDTAHFKAEARQSEIPTPKTVNGIKNAKTANLTAKVLEEEEERQKRRRTGENETLKSLFNKGTTQQQRNTDFMTRGFSIPAGAKHQ